jgi:tRNA nucleotidyltransferase (CCA-adding enzyme)
LEQHPYPQREYVLQALVACNRIQARDVMEEGITGKAIGEALTRKRVSALKQFKQQFTTQDKTQ